MASKLLSAILRGKFLIEREYALSQLPLVASLLGGNQVVFAGNQKETVNPYFTNVAEYDENGYKPLVALSGSGSTIRASRRRSFDEAPEGSLALIPVTGPILKYGGECGEPGSTHITDWVKQANASHKIAGIIMRIDSPGGQVDGTASLADAIKNSAKPVIGFVDDGMMASAAMWIGSACHELYASQATDTIGSIGVYTTLYDFEEYLTKMGVKLHQIYAPQSTEKNADYKKALEGDYKAIESDLKFICEQFISTIKTNRSGKLNLSAGDPFKGAMYFADEAIKIGLIDGIKSFDQVVTEMMTSKSKGAGTGANPQSTSNHNIMFGSNFKKVSALKGKKAEEITAEDIQAANAELVVEGITGVVLGPDQSARILELEQKLSAAEATEKTSSAKIVELEAKIGELGLQPGDKPTNAPKGKEAIADPQATEFSKHSHNQEALKDIANL